VKSITLSSGAEQNTFEHVLFFSATVASGAVANKFTYCSTTTNGTKIYDSGTDTIIEYTRQGFVSSAIVPSNKVGMKTNASEPTAVTLVAGDPEIQIFTATLTANRTIALSTTGARLGDKFRIVRLAGTPGAYTLTIGTGFKVIPSSTNAFVDTVFDGSAWQLTGYGTV
jgi:hypothetical protein